MKLSRPCAVAVLVGTLSFGAVPLAHAAFRDVATARSTFSAAQLAAPAGLTVTKRCTLGALGVVLGAALDLVWTPSGTSWANGQQVVVTNGAGVTITTKSLSASAASTTVDLSLINDGPYTVRVRATYSGWTSAAATATSSGC